MPLTKAQKEQQVAEVKEVLTSATSIVFMSYDRLNVVDVTNLRNQLAQTQSRMRVVPKRLLKIASQAANVGFDPRAAEGQMAIVWGPDAIAPAKTLYEFAKQHETVHLLAGLLEGKMLSADEVTALAQLPSRQELLGQLASVLIGPLRGFAAVLSGIPRNFVCALQAVAHQKQTAA